MHNVQSDFRPIVHSDRSLVEIQSLQINISNQRQFINTVMAFMRNLLFFRILKLESTILASKIGSSVMNRTRSRLTLANRRISLNKSVQYGFTERPSTRDRSPPVGYI